MPPGITTGPNQNPTFPLLYWELFWSVPFDLFPSESTSLVHSSDQLQVLAAFPILGPGNKEKKS
jgi:hypothetical protein